MNESKRVFPISDAVRSGQKGMTLREYYAGLALGGYLANSKATLVGHDYPQVAVACVAIADALIDRLVKTANREVPME